MLRGLLAVGLIVSLGANLWLLSRAAPASPVDTGGGDRASPPGITPAPDPFQPAPRYIPSSARPEPTDRRRRETVSAQQPSPAVTPALDASDPAFATQVVDNNVQQTVLCEVGLAHLRRHWARQQPDTLNNIEAMLADAEERERLFTKALDEYVGVLSLDRADSRALEDRLTPLWSEQLALIGGALQRRPRNTLVSFEETKALFAREDEIIEALFGADASRRVRASQLERRTTIMALFAVHADQPWDDTIAW